MPVCSLCPGRIFKDEDAVRMHKRSKQHSTYPCAKCGKGLSSQQALDQHNTDKHRAIECRYCDREFSTEDGRSAHEKAKHPSTFECEYCDRHFTTDEGRLAHQKAKHTFECHHCDREFNCEEARRQHEDAKHPPSFECEYCDREFTTDEGRLAHQKALHLSFECYRCGREFSSPGARDQHQEAKHGVHFTQVGVVPKQDSQRAVKASASSTSPPSLPDSTSGDMFHSTGRISSIEVSNQGATVEPSCTCSICQRTLSSSSRTDGPCICSICQRTSLPSHTDSVPDDAADLVSPDDNHQDNSSERHDSVFQCTPCLMLFETAEAFRDHVCASRTTMLRSHCPICYSQFDDGPSLQKHLEGVEFTCQLCLIRCCSDEMLQDHLLGHPTCGKCDKFFVDNIALCAHVEADHPVVVCWDCEGTVVEKNDLELHYADSPAHPSCAFCGVGKKNSADMDEHIRDVHPSRAEIEGGGDVNASPKQPPGDYRENVIPELDCTPQSTVGPSDKPLEPHDSSSQMELDLPLSPRLPMPSQAEHVNEAVGSPRIIHGEELLGRSASPSPMLSEHGSDVSRSQLHASQGTDTAINNDTRPPSPVSSVSSEPSSNTSAHHSPASDSSQSIVFVSADGIPDYIRENRAILVATSAGSLSSGHTPLRLSSSSSLESLGIVVPRYKERADTNASSAMLRLHCRICLRDPCDDMTATICGHVFCKRCITQAVIAKSECPVCQSATLLYCLFKLDLSA